MSTVSTSTRSEGRKADYDVLILGAGLSGLTALQKIVENGNTDSVHLFEAQNRVGGRVCTYELNGVKMDKGASWVGPTQTRMYELLKQFSIKTTPQHEEGKNVIFYQGTSNFTDYFLIVLAFLNIISLIFFALPISISILVTSIAISAVQIIFLADKRVRMMQKHYKGLIPPISPLKLVQFAVAQFKLNYLASKINIDDPYSSPRAQEFDQISMLSWAETQLGSRSDSVTMQVFESATDAIFGCDMADLSLLHTLFYIKSAGNLDLLMNARGGAQQDRIVGGSSSLPHAIGNQYHDQITLNCPASFIDNSQKNIVTVHFQDGSVKTCKRLIIAIPPQIIASTISFTDLPSEKLAMMKAMKPGSLTKIFAVFKTAFWRKQGYSGMILNPNNQPCIVYDLSSDQNGILLGFIIQPHAPYFKIEEKQVRQEYFTNFLKKYLSGDLFDEQFLFYSDENFAEDDKYIQGCPVSVFGVGDWQKHHVVWKKPIGNLFWAATETSTVWNGYMEGAVRAGERAAAEVIQSLKSIE